MSLPFLANACMPTQLRGEWNGREGIGFQVWEITSNIASLCYYFYFLNQLHRDAICNLQAAWVWHPVLYNHYITYILWVIHWVLIQDS